MPDLTVQGYAASFTSERLLRVEIEVVLRLLAKGLSWSEVRHEVLAGNLFQTRRTSTATTYLTLVRRRIAWLDEPLRGLYLEGARSDALAILLYTFLASYRFPREFVLEELQHAYRDGRPVLDERQVINFMDRKREQHAQVAHWTAKSQQKILHVMLRILRECTLLEPLDQGWRVQPLAISPDLRAYVQQQYDYRHFLTMILAE